MRACFITVALCSSRARVLLLVGRGGRSDAAPAHTVASSRRLCGHPRQQGLLSPALNMLSSPASRYCFTASCAVECRGVDGAGAANLFIALIGQPVAPTCYSDGSTCWRLNRSTFSRSRAGSLVAIPLAAPPSRFSPRTSSSAWRGRPPGASPPAVKLISGRRDATDYFSVTPLLMLPFSFRFPSPAGFSRQDAENAGCRSILFAAMGVLVLASAVFLYFVEFGGKAGRVPEMTPVGEEIAPLE